LVGCVNFLGATSLPQFLARFFDRIEITSIEFWTPAIFYFVFSVVVATQSSIWSIGGAADKYVTKRKVPSSIPAAVLTFVCAILFLGNDSKSCRI
jgi:hypothetical protein